MSRKSAKGKRIAGSGEALQWRILLVDDEPTQRLIMARILARAGYKVATASNGKEALARIAESSFHMMITDWDMPEMDGPNLCRALRSIPGKGYVYTIMLNARDAIEHVVEGLRSGADDYLTKPVIEAELIARLHTGRRIVTLERSLHAAVAESRRLAYTHPLTGVHNRLHLVEHFPQELGHALGCNSPLCVIVLDIDYFKEVNDAYGHAAGSQVLVGAAALLRFLTQGAGGWLAHHGGDEFAIVLKDTRLSSAAALAEELRRRLCAEAIDANGVRVRVSASFGVSGSEGALPSYTTVDELLRVADRCVFESKLAGRNRVSVRSITDQEQKDGHGS